MEEVKEERNKWLDELKNETLACLRSKDMHSFACRVVRSKIKIMESGIWDDIKEMTYNPEWYTEDFVISKFDDLKSKEVI